MTEQIAKIFDSFTKQKYLMTIFFHRIEQKKNINEKKNISNRKKMR